MARNGGRIPRMLGGSPGVVLGLIAVVIALGGVAIAATTTGSTKQFTLCAKKHGGALRQSTSGKCLRTETKVVLNQTGPTGRPGVTGASGLAGADGHSGENGRAGSDAEVTPEGVTNVQPPASGTGCNPTTHTGVFCREGVDDTPGSGSSGSSGIGTGDLGTTSTVVYTNYGNGYQVAGFWKDPSGVVHLRGNLTTAGGAPGQAPSGPRSSSSPRGTGPRPPRSSR